MKPMLGGKRPGAGRKPSETSGVGTSIRFPPTIKSWLIQQAQEQETTVTALVIRAVEEMMDKEEAGE